MEINVLCEVDIEVRLDDYSKSFYNKRDDEWDGIEEVIQKDKYNAKITVVYNADLNPPAGKEYAFLTFEEIINIEIIN